MTESTTTVIDEMFKAGLHFGAARSRRHPSTGSFIFGSKNNIEIIDLEKTIGLIKSAQDFIESIAASGKPLLFVGNKNEAREIVKTAAESVDAPYVTQRWIGGTLTNIEEIKKRTARLTELREGEKTGALSKYTKRERTMFAKDVEDLEKTFGGIVDMKELPGALFIVDAGSEDTALTEARKKGIPVIALCNSDCDIRTVDYPIVANDTSVASISYVIELVKEAYEKGKKTAVAKKAAATDKSAEIAAKKTT